MQTGLPKKLLLKPGHHLLALNAPVDFVADSLADMPVGAAVTERASAEAYDAVLVFAEDSAALAEQLPSAIAALATGGLLWVGFPKGDSKRQTDLTRDRGWAPASDAGYEFVSLISLDKTWSGWRLKPVAAVKPGRRTRMQNMMAEQK